MTARWALTYKVVHQPYDHTTMLRDDMKIDDTDSEGFKDTRYCLGQPKRAFKSVSDWYKHEVVSKEVLMTRGLKIASGVFNGNGGYNLTRELALKAGAFAISGTTSELFGLIDKLGTGFYGTSFEKIKATDGSYLAIGWARVGKTKLKVPAGETATIVIIAPMVTWWGAGSKKEIYSDTGWKEFKIKDRDLPVAVAEDIQLTTLRELVKQGEGQKSDISVDEKYFDDKPRKKLR
jgi:hypothetical protein